MRIWYLKLLTMLRFSRICLPLLMSLVFGSTSAQSSKSAEPGEPGAKRRGELVYLVRQDCGSCHGMTLKGGLGTPLLPENVKDTPVEALVSIILDGVPDTPMPPWRGLLSEVEAGWIARQLKKGLPK